MYKFTCIIFLDSTYKWYHKIFVSLSGLLHSAWQSLGLFISRAIFHVYVHHIFFTHSSINGHTERFLEWKWKWSRSVMSSSLWPPWTVAYQAPPSMGFSRQEYQSGLPFPSSGDPPDPGKSELGTNAFCRPFLSLSSILVKQGFPCCLRYRRSMMWTVGVFPAFLLQHSFSSVEGKLFF